MRDLVFKNLTSSDKSRRTVSSYEAIDKEGIYTTICRHFVYKVLDITEDFKEKPDPQIFVRRSCNHSMHCESVFYRMKASLYVRNKEKLYLVMFSRSLRVVSQS